MNRLQIAVAVAQGMCSSKKVAERLLDLDRTARCMAQQCVAEAAMAIATRIECLALDVPVTAEGRLGVACPQSPSDVVRTRPAGSLAVHQAMPHVPAAGPTPKPTRSVRGRSGAGRVGGG